MTEFDQLKEQMKILYAQARLQKSLRLTLRAVWMGMAGTLLGWAAYVLFGWPPGPYAWIGIGLGAALIPITGVLISLYPVLTDLSPSGLWVYAIDRRLRQREQLSTAWEVAQNGKGGPVAALLVQETLAILPRARSEILKGGWFRKLDLAATTV